MSFSIDLDNFNTKRDTKKKKKASHSRPNQTTIHFLHFILNLVKNSEGKINNFGLHQWQYEKCGVFLLTLIASNIFKGYWAYI